MNEIIAAQNVIITKQDELIKILKKLDENQQVQIEKYKEMLRLTKEKLEIIERQLNSHPMSMDRN